MLIAYPETSVSGWKPTNQVLDGKLNGRTFCQEEIA